MKKLGRSAFEDQMREHRTWVASSGRFGRQLTVIEQDMRHLTLRDRDLVECLLIGCDLSHVVLDHSDLYGASLAWCTLLDATFVGCNLDKATLEHATARNASFYGARLVDCSGTSADFRGARFARSYLLSAGLDETDLRDATFAEADCDRTSFHDAVFSASELSTAFGGAIGALLEGNVILDEDGQRRTARTSDLVEAARSGGAELSVFDPSRAEDFRRPWRWGAPSARA